MKRRISKSVNKRFTVQLKIPPSKHKLGYTNKEILDIIRPLKIHHKRFWKKFGIGNTCSMDEKTGEFLFYKCDILTAILCCEENRDKYSWEWD